MKSVYVFECPMCAKTFRADEPGEPCCTGPSESRDDHELVIMRLLRIDKVEVHPMFAYKRAEGRLLLPTDEPEINREKRIILRD